MIGSKEPEVETASNSTIEPDESLLQLSDTQLTKLLFEHLCHVRPVSVTGKLPTQDDVRSIIAADFSVVNDLWKATAPKRVVSRYSFCKVCISYCAFFPVFFVVLYLSSSIVC